MIDCERLVRIYKTLDFEVQALQGLDLQVARGEMLALIGNSGSGKSTLLNLIGGLDRPTAGRLLVDGHDLLTLDDRARTLYKRRTVGFVWQNNARNLVPWLTAQENVEAPMLLEGVPRRERRERARALLETVGLAVRRRSRLAQLSGGEEQRVGIAIALANRPPLLLADEPTGSVDARTASLIYDLLRRLNREIGQTVVIVTHDRRVARLVERVVAIRDGRTSSELVLRQGYRERLEQLRAEGATLAHDPESTHEEWIVLDSAGRLQLPRDQLDALGLQGRGRLQSEVCDGRIVLTPESKEEKEGTDEKEDPAP